MSQSGLFDLDERLAAISAKGDVLETIKASVPWETFRADIEAAVEAQASARANAAAVRAPKSAPSKNNAGRKGYDAILKFKMLTLQSLYNLSDEQIEMQVRDRLSFMRFLDLELRDAVPDATTIWLFREALVEAKLIDTLFERFSQNLAAKGFLARGGQIIDATMVTVPIQRNTKDENATVKSGEVPKDWAEKPAKLEQKDTDARWTKKHGKSYFGYKNHVGIDKAHKLVRTFDVTDASVHDSQKLDAVLDENNTGKDVWADSAYRSEETEAKLKTKGLKSRIHRRGARNHPLTKAQDAVNKSRSKIRARVEHVFGHQTVSMGRKIVRTIGIARARFKIGMMNLGYNMRRLTVLQRPGRAAPA